MVIEATSDIVIREEGDFGSAKGWLKQLLADNLKRALRTSRLDGEGPALEIVVATRAARWQDLPQDSLARLASIDGFEIEIGAAPKRRVLITGQTPLAAGFGVMAFLEDHVGVHWAFPGRLGLCLPSAGGVTLREGVFRAEPFVIGRTLSGLDLRATATQQPTRKTEGVLREQRGFFLVDDYFKSLRLRSGSVSHAMIRVFPVDRCRTECPEIFPKHADGTLFIPP